MCWDLERRRWETAGAFAIAFDPYCRIKIARGSWNYPCGSIKWLKRPARFMSRRSNAALEECDSAPEGEIITWDGKI
jgi:hypothetical protein